MQRGEIKICHMSDAHSAEDERIFHKECVSLATAGYDTYLVATGESYEKNGVHIVGVGKKPSSRLKRMIMTTNAVYKKALKIDAQIYHLHDLELLPCALKLKKKGKKVIFDSHENYSALFESKTYLPKFVRKIVGGLFGTYYKSVLHYFSAIVTATSSVSDELKNFNDKVVTITNYPVIDPNYVPPIHENHRTLVFAGGISEQWCHRQVLQAMEGCQNIRYVLCGDGDGQYTRSLQKMSAWEQVDYRGRLPHEKIRDILASADIGVCILKYSGNTSGKLGNLANTKLFEEMEVGLPIVCTDFTLWQEIINTYQCGICVAPNDIQKITDAITYLVEHPKIASQMGKNAARAVRENYNWASQEKILIRLYAELLQEK